MATIKDIADRLGIAVSTVSKGLNGATDISDSTRQMVLDTAVQLGYSSKKVKLHHQKKLCIFIKNMSYESADNFGYEIVLGFQMAASSSGWEVNIVPFDSSLKDMNNYDTYMLSNSYTGAFLLGLTPNDSYMGQIEKTTFPTVLLDNLTTNTHTGYIGTDSHQGMKMIVDLLISLGHRNIAMLNGDRGSMVTEERCHAFINCLKSHGLSTDKCIIKYGDYTSSWTSKCLPDIINSGATAIVCGSDIIALGVLNQLSQMGLKVPEDISVTGYDDLPMAQYSLPPLTTIHQNRMTLGKIAFTLLDSLIQDIPISKILLHPQLMVRSSTGPASSIHNK